MDEAASRVKLREFSAPADHLDCLLYTSGKEVKMYLKEGQKVLMSQYAGTNVKIDGQEYIILRQSDILAIVE